MLAQRALRRIAPIVGRGPALRIEGIGDPVLGMALADDQQPDRVLGVVQKAMGDARPRREGDPVTRAQAMELAVDPGIGVTLHDIDELFVTLMGMRLGAAAARRNCLEIDPEAAEAEPAAEGRQHGEEIAAARGSFDLGEMLDEAGSLRP